MALVCKDIQYYVQDDLTRELNIPVLRQLYRFQGIIPYNNKARNVHVHDMIFAPLWMSKSVTKPEFSSMVSL